MTAIEIARRLSELGETEQAQQAYHLALQQGCGPAEKLEAALYILQSGGDYKVSYTCFLELHRQGQFREECLDIMTQAFYDPNVKLLKSTYQKNCKLLSKYPYLFRNDFPDFEFLPLRFYPYDDNRYVPYAAAEGTFGEYIDFRRPVVGRNFFRDLDKPVLAEDVFSQYELEYLVDNVRKSEWVGRENHVYLHYADWGTFCSHLQCLNLKWVLEDEKIVFLIGDEIAQYPIDFKERFGIDYSRYPVKPLGVREINKLIWHTQLASHNGGDFFNEIFDAHPNLVAVPSLMFDSVEESVAKIEAVLRECGSAQEAAGCLPDWDAGIATELYLLRDRTEKDIMVAKFLNDKGWKSLDKSARIVPALFFQPHFANLVYDLYVNQRGEATLGSKQYERVRTSPLFQGFKYIKTFTPLRRPTTSHGAAIKFMCADIQRRREKGDPILTQDELTRRILNRSFMIDWQDRLYMDSALVRFEDAKLNPKATFTALATFLDVPYTESMTYCSLNGKVDPESMPGNDIGFSNAAVYRTYDEYVNDSERYFIEYFLRDVYEFYGYDFQYYDGAPVDLARVEELIGGFGVLDHYIQETCKELFGREKTTQTGQETEREADAETKEKLADSYMKLLAENRRKNAEILLQGLRFVNKNGQPLHMMPKLELDTALLEQPLYH